MRVRGIAVVAVLAGAIGVAVWRPWRDAGPSPEDVSRSADPTANVAAPPPPQAAAPPPVPDPAVPAPDPRSPIARLAARDAWVPPDAGEANAARFRALHQAMANTTPDAARLYANFARMRITPPPEAKTLIEMQQRGEPRDQLIKYARENFHDLVARAIALRWLGVGSVPAAGAASPPAGRPAADPTSVTGTLTRRDGG